MAFSRAWVSCKNGGKTPFLKIREENPLLLQWQSHFSSKNKEGIQMAKSAAPARSHVLARRETFVSYMFLLPCLVFFVGFVIVPMFMCLFTSFFDYTMTDFEFIGLQNYIEIFQDENIQKRAACLSQRNPLAQIDRHIIIRE